MIKRIGKKLNLDKLKAYCSIIFVDQRDRRADKIFIERIV